MNGVKRRLGQSEQRGAYRMGGAMSTSFAVILSFKTPFSCSWIFPSRLQREVFVADSKANAQWNQPRIPDDLVIAEA